MVRLMLVTIFAMVALTMLAADSSEKIDEAVVAFIKGKIAEIEQTLAAYYIAKDRMSEKPIGSYEGFYSEARFKFHPVGIKEDIRQIKLFKKFLSEDFTDAKEINGKFGDYLKLKLKTESDSKNAKELLVRKRNLGKLPWAKCEYDMKTIDEKSYRKLRDAYWKLVEKYFKKYGI